MKAWIQRGSVDYLLSCHGVLRKQVKNVIASESSWNHIFNFAHMVIITIAFKYIASDIIIFNKNEKTSREIPLK